MKKELKSLAVELKQQMLYSGLLFLGLSVTRIFFSAQLYILSNSIALTFVDQMLQQISIMSVITFGSWLVQRVGYQPVYRLAHGVTAAMSFVLLLAWPLIETDPFRWFWLFSITIGSASGLYHSAHHYMMVAVLGDRERSYSLNIFSFVGALKNVGLPLLIGFLLGFVINYRWLFVAPIVIGLIGVRGFYRDHNRVPKSNHKLLSTKYFKKLIRKPHSKHFLWIYIVDTIEDEIQRGFWAIVPFIIIGDIFGYGVFLSVMALIGGVAAFTRRNSGLSDNFRLGYILHSIRVLATVGLVGWWQTSALTVRAAIEDSAKKIERPIDENLDSTLREMVLGDDLEEDVIQLNYLLEIIKFIGRMVSMSALLVGVYLISSTELFIRWVWPLIASFGLLTFWLQVRLYRKLKHQ